MPCEHQTDFFVNQPVNQVFGYLSSLPIIAGIKVKYVDPINYQIHLKVNMSFFTWGEDITIAFYDSQNGGTRIIAFSKPSLPTVLVDFGRNKKNVEEIMRYILWIYEPKVNQC